jgi:hypothetical protein
MSSVGAADMTTSFLFQSSSKTSTDAKCILIPKVEQSSASCRSNVTSSWGLNTKEKIFTIVILTPALMFQRFTVLRKYDYGSVSSLDLYGWSPITNSSQFRFQIVIAKLKLKLKFTFSKRKLKLPVVRINCVNDPSKLILVKNGNNDDAINLNRNVQQGRQQHRRGRSQHKSVTTNLEILKIGKKPFLKSRIFVGKILIWNLEFLWGKYSFEEKILFYGRNKRRMLINLIIFLFFFHISICCWPSSFNLWSPIGALITSMN